VIKQDKIRIDLKRIVYRAGQYWYIVLASFLFGVGIAYFKTRYAVPIYPVSASIVIKEKEEATEGKLLYNNPLVSGFRNYLNELYIIRSYPLIERTLRDINFGVAFYTEGNVLTTEVYDIPIDTHIINDSDVGNANFYFKYLDNNRFQLIEHDDIEKNKGAIYNFGDTISRDGLSIVFEPKPGSDQPLEVGSLYLFTYTSPNQLAGSYVSRLSATWAEEGAGVINLSITGSNPKKEVDFLRGLIRHYQLYDLNKKNEAATRTIDFITGQLSGISDSLHNVEQQLERFKDQNVLMDLSGEAKRLYEKLTPLEAQKVELNVKRNYYKYLTDYIQSAENLDQIILPSSVGISDGILNSLMSRMIDIQLQIKMNGKPNNPMVSESKRLIGEIKQDIIESVRNQKMADQIKQEYLDKQINELNRQLNYLPLAERKLVSIQRNYSLLENLYIFLLQKKAEASISKASSTADIDIVNPPMVIGGAVTAKPFSNYLLGILFGIGIPFAVFFVMEAFNTKIQSREDVEKVTTIPFIAGVGHKRGENNLEVLTAPKSSIAESFRALRSNLNYFLAKRDNAVFLITSSISGEGKTFTSVNLASVFALSEKKTVIIGADMRKPKIYQDFNLSNETGLSSYLAGLSNFDTIVQATANPFLDLISGGPVPPNPSELLMNAKMEEFLAEAKKRYDYVIIDTPPLAIVTDAFLLSAYADHTLFLVRQNYTPKVLLRTADDFYISGKFKNMSIVLNDIYRSGPGYGYGYNYGYGYGYGYGVLRSRKKDGSHGYYTES